MRPVSDESAFLPEWPAPPGVHALVTTRRGGVSEGPWQSFNLGVHVHDAPAAVRANRAKLARISGLAQDAFHWLEQVHGNRVVRVPAMEATPVADAAWTDQPGQACAVMTADCLPVLFCDDQASRVAVAHAGWRGLAAGVLEAALGVFPEPARVLAYLGPAIGPAAFEVGDEVRTTFTADDPEAAFHFQPASSLGETWYADLYGLARQRLETAGVTRIFGGCACTFSDEADFFSYRRDGTTGRMASLIWLDNA
ncbi:peptidoglycan editing factor PgeF [Salicola sp. Rm-C-2C1-2]|uniref:peptidoglycan editing factor PgeF n=1 Tax=Salicola sp. Rm-C-2C1-2 TaxID=3141321 RepID=UPI0032E41945